ncbi:2-hydroxychromene-2-carboxylate isomerase [Polyangium jinanense]|uniref:2-hydroxychromene-2-carboxylate isomerase n=1 Tax=Polyangium jinanense TaxID=2829994 RepID=A0A9X4APL5_9BACT|nr:2-hydroxychromene-2-carboxylate isomerase [Polyangium jinanense]MDC3952510.1 2-hydroxychromene-2-carboxylate isomerase [Polyangium jinanense]MDC3980138.1 2-hydroxychromene-2-carboxylate isomerase [Polyangium jinanense]
MKRVEFFFDFSSPFAYLASTQIEDLAARKGASLVYRPFLLGALFKAIGTPNVPLFAMPEPKQRLVRADLHRWADHWGVPFRFASRFPMNTVKPLRMVLAAPEDRVSALVAAVYRAYWVEDRDISADEVLADIATSVGLDGAALVAATVDERMKQRLKDVTEQAERIGVCGAPSFLVDDLLFWGQDRLLFVEKALDGWRPKES